MMRKSSLVSLAIASVCVLGAACGDDGDKGGGGGGAGSYTDIADAISSPTGTVSAETAPAIKAEFDKISAASGTGATTKQASQGQPQQCAAGGTQTVQGESNGGNSATATLSYDDCCFAAECCLNGGGKFFYSTGGGGAAADGGSASFSFCGSYDVTTTCGGQGEASVKYNGCFGANGTMTYVIEVEGDTYAVSGSYANGAGTLTVKGANGTYTCTYNDDGGSCTGDSGNFEF